MRLKRTAISAALLAAALAGPAWAQQPKDWGKRVKPDVADTVAVVDRPACPLCAHAVDRVLTAPATEYELDTDYKVVKASFNVYPYVLTACPKCSYATYSANFHKELRADDKKALEEGLEEVRREFKSEWDIPLSHVIRAASATHRALKSEAGTLYEIYLLGSYLAREATDPTAERDMQRRAIEHLAVAIEKEEKFQTPKNRYMAGEIQRRLGNYKQALEWYAKAKLGADDMLTKIITRQENQTKEAMDPKKPPKK
jgi:hypothetical protein